MTSTPDLVTLSTPGDLATAVPHLLGFVPRESLVVVTATMPRHRFGLTLRQDLLDESCDNEVADVLAQRVARQAADVVFLLVFTDAVPDAAGLPRQRLVQQLVEQLSDRLDVAVRDALCVSDGRWWSYLCHDPGCCPPQGTALDGQSRSAVSMSAAYALRGRAVVASRDELVASLARVEGEAATQVAEQVTRAMRSFGRSSTERRLATVRRLLGKVLARYDDPRASVTVGEAATLQVACHDIDVRDAVLFDATTARDRLQQVMRDVVRLGVPSLDAPVLSIFAWLAYESGDGVVVAAALERALESDPAYGLARLLCEALDSQLPPAALRQACRDGPSSEVG